MSKALAGNGVEYKLCEFVYRGRNTKELSRIISWARAYIYIYIYTVIYIDIPNESSSWQAIYLEHARIRTPIYIYRNT